MALREDIEQAINRNSAENGSNTPDFILAEYLETCLRAFDAAVLSRATWYGRYDRPALPAAAPEPLPLGHEFKRGNPYHPDACCLRGIFGFCGQPESAHRPANKGE